MVVAQLLKIAQFGPQPKDQSIGKLMRERIIQDAYPIHDGLPYWTEEGRLCERQVLLLLLLKSVCLNELPDRF